MLRSDPEALLFTGVFGSGKSSLTVEVADILEKRGEPYAALDLDWLCWFDTGSGKDESVEEMLWDNLAVVVKNYLEAGIGRFVLAGSILEKEERERLADAINMPTTIVRLTVPISEIERRLRADVTTSRRDDLRIARKWAASSTGVGVEDFVVENKRPISEVAEDVLNLIGWDQQSD
jgi:adenylylsulfate kinase